jgi:nitronate monooxygenase
MKSPLSDLNLTNPVLAAPMAGGPSTPAYVTAAARAGSLGFLAAGYKTPQLLAEQIGQVLDQSQTFGVNLFAPNPLPVDPEAFRRYAASIQGEADRYGIDFSQITPREDDDSWRDKIDLLLAHPVPVVSFTFGIPDSATIAALRKAGTVTVQTVTSIIEARLAASTGVDVLAVQASAAGGHSGTLTPQRPPEAVPLCVLIATIRDGTKLPIIAAGGLSTATQVASIMQSGADAVMVGTVLLRGDESGASAVHKASIADHARGDTVVTRAFTGRPARGLPNSFITDHEADAPLGYPAIHFLTSELRKAAARDGNPELVNLWAGTGYRNASSEPVGDILNRLAQAI